MKTTAFLPEHYRECYALDLEKNKKSALYINLFGGMITLIMAVVMNFLLPISSLFERNTGVGGLLVRLLVLLVLLTVYIVLHELTHGITMKILGCQKVTYGFSGIYAYAGSEEFFSKNAYLAVALAPVFLWGIVISAICMLVPTSWFWIFYIIQIANIAGAAGDYYVAFHFFFLPEDILIYDTGTAMTVYSPRKYENTKAEL